MGSNIREFEIGLNQFAAGTEKAMSLIVRKVALEALRRIINRTPVDTGRARGNWQVSLGQPADGAIETTDKEGNTTFSKGGAVVAKVDPFGQVWISNNVPYIERLEHGHSQRQAPNGMVGVTIAELEQIFG